MQHYWRSRLTDYIYFGLCKFNKKTDTLRPERRISLSPALANSDQWQSMGGGGEKSRKFLHPNILK